MIATSFLITFVGYFIFVPLLFAVARMLGVYTIVHERRCHVYVLFGTVEAKIDEADNDFPEHL